MKILGNTLEEQTKLSSCKYIRFIHSYEEDNTETVVAILKSENNNPKIFFNIKSPILTHNGNPKTTEMAIHYPAVKIDWRIECKYQRTDSPKPYEETDKAIFLKERLILVLEGYLGTKRYINQLRRYINSKGLYNKVWCGNLKQYERMLYDKIKYESNKK